MTSTQSTSQPGLITITREFDAAREAVFSAWTNPNEVAAWFGPAGMSVPEELITIDLRVGGRFEITMSRPNGAKYPIIYEIRELVEPELLVLRSEANPEMGIPEPVTVRVELEATATGTRMTLTDGPHAEPGKTYAEGGWQSAFDKLVDHLGS